MPGRSTPYEASAVRRSRRRGAVLAEFAIAFPVVLLAYLCFLQMAQGFTAGLVMRHATIVLARYASVSLPNRFIPDPADHAGSTNNPSFEDAARRALGPWQNAVHVKDVDVQVDGRDAWATLRTRADFEYACHVPMGKLIVCKDGVLTRTIRINSPLSGATYVR